MAIIYSYVLRFDDGGAPNPFWDTCTLTICKPAIRRKASIGDWVIGTGSKNSKCSDGIVYDLSDCLVYAMKITDIKTLEEYDIFCKTSLPNKIPNWGSSDWQLRMGDCIYDYSKGFDPVIRKSVHNEQNRRRDLSGINSLLSNNFYYFGERAMFLPTDLKELIKRNQGHKKIENPDLISRFEKWIEKLPKNMLIGDPQMRSVFDKTLTDEIVAVCAKQRCAEGEDETEETIC